MLYTLLLYSSTDLHRLPRVCNWSERDCSLYHRSSSAVLPEIPPAAKTCYFVAIPADKRIAPAVVQLCQGSLVFCKRRSLVAVQHSTGRRTLCQGSLLHPHSSPSLGLQLTGTSTSGIPSLRDRLGQSWYEELQTVFWSHYRVMSEGHVV